MQNLIKIILFALENGKNRNEWKCKIKNPTEIIYNKPKDAEQNPLVYFGPSPWYSLRCIYRILITSSTENKKTKH